VSLRFFYAKGGTVAGLAAVLLAQGASSEGSPVAAANPAQVEFFEKSVRPLLEEHCVECHSAAKGKTKGGLALDNAAAVRKGGDTGPALVPGAPEKSLLVKAVTYADPDLKMPPDNKRMPSEQVAILQEWVRSGAYDPREGKTLGVDPEAAKKHWAFQPVQKPTVPGVHEPKWARTDTDRFVLAALEAKGIAPAKEADRRTLLKRLSYDLQGLPPTAEELTVFATDPAPEAYEKAVDRMLASPRFGERWGRHWLDVARYSDTKGLPSPINADRRFHFAYSYRDYVINAFNSDKPFDQFIKEQLAADLLAEPKSPESLAALGYLTVGRCFQNSLHDIIDDRIDVVTRGLVGLTVSCARCHDHKYDPIPTADYYSLHGVFMSTEEPKERPVISTPKETPEYQKYLEKRAVLLDKKEGAVEGEIKKANVELVKKIPLYLVATKDIPAATDDKALETLAGQRNLLGLALGRWMKLLTNSAEDSVFGPWSALAALNSEQFAAESAALLSRWKSEPPAGWNAAVLGALSEKPLKTLADAAAVYGKLCADTQAVLEKRASEDTTVLSDLLQETLRTRVFQPGGPGILNKAETEKAYSRKVFEARSKAQDELDVLDSTDLSAPDRAMVLYDKPQAVQPVVFIRGNSGNRGANVPRQFLSILSGPERKPFTQGSGRLELARAIADPSNPLTARVAVNRIWLHLFGKGLVETPNDFGVRTSAPAIPGVLDHLATRFVEAGWSTKTIVRELVLSSAYRQSSAARPEALAVNPNNDLVHTMHRRRLDFESLRDTLLQTAGALDETYGGRPVELTKEPFSGRRSVYGYIDRQDLPSMFRIFDFANPDISTGQRFETTVPQQALFLMNNGFLKNLSDSAAKLPAIAASAPGQERVKALFERILKRQPRPEEMEAALRLVAGFAGQPEKSWSALSQVLLLTNELAFVD
jgi:mono/diheme cytochrome c family protein